MKIHFLIKTKMSFFALNCFDMLMLQANFGSLFRLKGQAFVKLLRELLADAKSTSSYSLGLHLSVFQGKSKRGAFKMFEKYVLKISTISNNAENGICPIKKGRQ